MQHAVAYYRVSTAKQGRSGLGIEAQRAAVARFADAEGYTLIAEFTEVETGKGVDAPRGATSDGDGVVMPHLSRQSATAEWAEGVVRQPDHRRDKQKHGGKSSNHDYE